MELIDGKEYWTMLESCCDECLTEFPPQLPWKGTLKISKRYGMTLTPKDKYQQRYVKDTELFETEQEALKQYKKQLKHYIDTEHERLKELETILYKLT